MSTNAVVCVHCQRKGVHRELGPSTRNTPLVVRSDDLTFHVYLEELHPFRLSGDRPKMAALFRYTMESPSAQAESTLVMIPETGDPTELLRSVEAAADALERIMKDKKLPKSSYTPRDWDGNT